MMEREDAAGVWVSDDGVFWTLAVPSPEWQAARAADVSEPEPDPLTELQAQVAAQQQIIDDLLNQLGGQ